MDILHIDAGREMRGGQRQVLLLLDGLRQAGHNGVLLARPGSPLWSSGISGGFAVKPVTIQNVRKASHSVCLVHAHDAHSHTLAALASSAKFVVSRRVAFPVRTAILSRWKYGRATRFLAVSGFVAQQLEAAGILRDRIDVVYDGLKDDANEATEWRRDAPAVALATLDPKKGRDLVEEAAALANVPVVFSDDLTRDLADASVFVYITRSEGFGSAVLVAMHKRVPVIASRVGGLPEAITDGVSGLLVENRPQEIAAAIMKVRADPRLARALIENASVLYHEKFTQQRMVEATVASYLRALAG